MALTALNTSLATAAPAYRNADEALAAFAPQALETLIPAEKHGWQALDFRHNSDDCNSEVLIASGAIGLDGNLAITAAQKNQIMKAWNLTGKPICLRVAGYAFRLEVESTDSGRYKLVLVSMQTGDEVYASHSFPPGAKPLAAAFDGFSVNALDVLLPGGRTWKVVRGENGLLPEIDTESTRGLEGSVNSDGKIILTPAQQRHARELLLQHPNELGIVFAGYLFQFRLNVSSGGVEISLPYYDDQERIRRIHTRWKPYQSVQEALTTFTIDLNTDLEVFPALLPQELKNWRFLRRPPQDGHRDQVSLIAAGKLGDNQLTLTHDQGKKLWQAWKHNPEDIWLQAGNLSFRLSIRKNPDGRYMVDLLDDSGIDPRSKRISLLERQQKIDPVFYTQAGYPASQYRQEYKDWKLRFEADLEQLKYAMRSSTDLPWRDLEANESQLHALNSKQQQSLAKLFTNSIDDGPKGLMIRLFIIEAIFSRDRRVLPVGTVIVKLLTDTQTQPVGYGGVFKDGVNPVELWYIVLDNPREWTTAQLEESIIYRRFQPMALPDYGTIVRNRWPALTFNRDTKGRLKLYAISAELATIIRAVFDAQTS